MRLVKRYFDLIDADGHFLIGYDAVAQMGPLPLRYRALLSSHPEFNRQQLSLQREAARVEDFPRSLRFGGEVSWLCSSSPVSNGGELRSGPISWRVHAIGDGMHAACGESILAGRGYSETVTLEAPPWRLGLNKIRWGRFLGTRHSAVWNVATGANAYAFAAFDDEFDTAPRLSEDCIETEAGRITLGRRVRTVHEGDVLERELSMLAPLIRVLHGGAYRVVQLKHVREARLAPRHGEPEDGLAMDETVVLG